MAENLRARKLLFFVEDIKELVWVYEGLVAELREVYYNQDGEAIEAATKKINKLLERWGFTDDDWT